MLQIIKRYEKELFSVCRKSQEALSPHENEILHIISKTREYLRDHDAIEKDVQCAVFEACYLCPHNDGRTLVALAADMGMSKRTLIRYKQKVLKAYCHFYAEYYAK